jgi:hypothetical protein
MDLIIEDDVICEIFKTCTDLPNVYKWSSLNRQFRKAYRMLPVQVYVDKVGDNKYEQLQVFINYYAYLPPQGSAEWKEAKEGDHDRSPTIGGSEIGTVLGANPHSIAKSLVASKLKIGKPFMGNTATRWGNLFEEVASSIMEFRFKTDTYETGSIPGLRSPSGELMQTYSPDRLGVITGTQLWKILREFNSMRDLDELDLKIDNKNKVILFEFKCPLTRVPDKKVPSQYKSQPQLGALTIPIVDLCVFVDSMFRKCNIEDFGFNPEYDRCFHSSDPDGPPGGGDPPNPILCGFIGIYSLSQPASEETLEALEAKFEADELARQIRETAPVFHKKSDYYTPDSSANVEKLQPIMEALTPKMEPKPAVVKPLVVIPVPPVQEVKQKPDLPDKEIPKLANYLLKWINVEINTEGSEFQNLMGNDISDIFSVISVCDMYVNRLYLDCPEFAKYNITVKDEEKIVIATIQYMMSPEYHEIIRAIVPDGLRVNYKLRHPTCSVMISDLSELMFGDDLGDLDSRAFENRLKAIVDERFTPDGVRAYYPNKFYQSEQDIDRSYIDMSLDEPERAQKWLATNVNDFIKFCKDKNYRPVGILPWKLFKQSIIPITKDPEFLNKIYNRLVEITRVIREIKQTADSKLPPSEKIKTYEKTFNDRFPPTAKTLAMREKKALARSGVRTGDDVEAMWNENHPPPGGNVMAGLIEDPEGDDEKNNESKPEIIFEKDEWNIVS